MAILVTFFHVFFQYLTLENKNEFFLIQLFQSKPINLIDLNQPYSTLFNFLENHVELCV